MTPGTRKSLIVAAVHVLLVATLGGKLLVDRATRPRGWAHAEPYDPDLPIRGRYVRLKVLVPLADPAAARDTGQVALLVRDERVTALPTVVGERGLSASYETRNGQPQATLDQPVAYFIPEHVPDPSIRPADEELWVEVTIPRAGAPRPIRLGVNRNGVITPLDLN